MLGVTWGDRARSARWSRQADEARSNDAGSQMSGRQQPCPGAPGVSWRTFRHPPQSWVSFNPVRPVNTWPQALPRASGLLSCSTARMSPLLGLSSHEGSDFQRPQAEPADQIRGRFQNGKTQERASGSQEEPQKSRWERPSLQQLHMGRDSGSVWSIVFRFLWVGGSRGLV